MSEKDLLEELLNADSEETSETHISEDKILAPLLGEINLISDQTIKVFVRSILLKAKNFWTIPSSFSGKYHPPDERGEGGNVLHTKRVVRLVKLICESQERMIIETDLMIAAAILHDVMKGGESDTPQYDPLHPYTVDNLVNRTREEDEDLMGEEKSNSIYLEEEYVQQILRLIRCHLGKWSPIPETMPITTLEWSLHMADAIAAELHIIIDGSEINERRWDV